MPRRALAGRRAAFALLLGGLPAGPPAAAETVTGTGTVTANVQGSCSLVAAPTFAFGTVGSLGTLAADVTATGTITVACSGGVAYTIYLGDGAGRVGTGTGNRRMANGAGRLPYQLYKNGGHTAVWDSTGGTTAVGGAGGVHGVGNGSKQNHVVYGRIAAGTVIPSVLGNYSDTVLVVVTY